MLITEARQAGAREEKACTELGITLRTLQRWRLDTQGQGDRRPTAKRPVPKNKLTLDEEQEIIKVTNTAEFCSLPPSQIVPALADAGVYIASESSFYRVLRAHSRQHHRGKSSKPIKRPLSTHCATGPNQVWMWNISWLSGPVKGLYFYLYLIIDLYSRKIVGWEIWPEESADHASVLIRRTVIKEKLASDDVVALELIIDRYSGLISDQKGFILNGSNKQSANLHICRTICRRAERRIVGLAEHEEIDEYIIKFVNRLSDLLYILARYMESEEKIV